MRKLPFPTDQRPHMAGEKRRGVMALSYLIVIALVVFTSLPLVYIVSSAFKPLEELTLYPPRFFVQHPTGRNFQNLVVSLGSSSVPFLRYVFNSVAISGTVVFLTVVVCSMAAFALSKLKVPFSGAIFKIIIAAMMFSAHVTTIPRFMVVNFLGMYDTYFALVLPQIAVAYNLFLMKQFIDQFPLEILEAAQIDGAGNGRIYCSVLMPSQKPVIATLVTLSFVSCWNDYFSPLIYTSSETMKSLPLALQTIAGGAGAVSVSRAGAVAAANLVMIVPVVLLFMVMQKQVMQTMTHSGIKG